MKTTKEIIEKFNREVETYDTAETRNGPFTRIS